MDNKIAIPIELNDNNNFKINIYSENEKNTIKTISEPEAIEFNESRFQLLEGCSYEYDCPNGYSLKPIKSIITKSKIHENSGRITTGFYTGKLTIKVLNIHSNEVCGELVLEIRSVKTNYRDDYRIMLEEITQESVAIIMDENSPVSQYFSMDYSGNTESLYQRFSFVKSMILSEKFDESIHQIIKYPVSNWDQQEETIHASRLKKVDHRIMQQIGRSSNRTKLPKSSNLSQRFSSFPNQLTAYEMIDSLDTSENQFIKFVLVMLRDFVFDIKYQLKNKEEIEDANYILEKLNNKLNDDFFREISDLQVMNLNSPILQRKEGYREIYKIWIAFDVASRLFWKGSEEIFSAGQKNIALLYEYWVFFKLLEIIKNKFWIEGKSFSNLIEKTKSGLGLKLKSGKHLLIKGVFKSKKREFQIEFSYNKTFKGDEIYPNNGSWTRQMRPDYSLCIWPKGFTKEEATIQEIITFIHFDAKYKIQNYVDNYMSKNDVEDLSGDIAEEYKRDDLIKMHAYKDAIRRTAGAYIIYPGNKSYIKRGYHELLPGLGAFPLNPSDKLQDTSEINKFIDGVIEHLYNRASQREKLSYYKFDIFRNKINDNINEKLPEKFIDERIMPIDNIFVIVGYVKDVDHFKWIESNKLYNLRIDNVKGSVNLDLKKSSAKYILLYNNTFIKNGLLKKIKEEGPKIYSKKQMIKLEYRKPRDFYLIYRISSNVSDIFSQNNWDIERILEENSKEIFGEPITLSLKELMKYKL